MARYKEPTHLPVLSVFYRGNEVVKKIRSGHPINAVGNATKHMRRNTYDATVVEVFSTAHGQLYSVMKRDVKGNAHILYEHEFNPRKDK